MDNQTAVTYINNMGGTHSLKCNDLAKEIILWCINKNIWLSSSHIAGVKNETADGLSRIIHEDIEWMLRKNCFHKVCHAFGVPEIDVFANRVNKQLPKYFSYHPDDQAITINAFSCNWNFFAYLFPPFNLIPRVLRKIREDKTRAIIIVPKWKGAPWYPKLMSMIVKPPVQLGKNPRNLILPHRPSKIHTLQPLSLMGCLLFGGN